MSKKKKIVIITIVALLIVALISANIIVNINGGKVETVKATVIKTQDLTYTVTSSGMLEESKSSSVYLDATVPITDVKVKLYQKVKKGEVLAIMDTSSIVTTYDAKVVDTAATKKAQAAAAAKATANPAATTSPIVIYKTVKKPLADAVKRKNKIISLTKAPISGIVSTINVVDNGYATNMQPSFVIINTDNMKAIANVKESDISKIKTGMKVKITGDSIDSSKTVMGKVSKIAPVASQSTTASGTETTVETTIKITESNAKLLPKANIDCEFQIAAKKNVPVVNFNMIKEDKDGNKSVFVIDTKKNILIERRVKIGLVSDIYAEVLSGLNNGETVCSSPLPYYKDGMKIKYTISED